MNRTVLPIVIYIYTSPIHPVFFLLWCILLLCGTPDPWGYIQYIFEHFPFPASFLSIHFCIPFCLICHLPIYCNMCFDRTQIISHLIHFNYQCVVRSGADTHSHTKKLAWFKAHVKLIYVTVQGEQFDIHDLTSTRTNPLSHSLWLGIPLCIGKKPCFSVYCSEMEHPLTAILSSFLLPRGASRNNRCAWQIEPQSNMTVKSLVLSMKVLPTLWICLSFQLWISRNQRGYSGLTN